MQTQAISSVERTEGVLSFLQKAGRSGSPTSSPAKFLGGTRPIHLTDNVLMLPSEYES